MENLNFTKEQVIEHLTTRLAGKPYSSYDFSYQVYTAIRDLFPKEEQQFISHTQVNNEQTVWITYKKVWMFCITVHKAISKRYRLYGQNRVDYVFCYFESHFSGTLKDQLALAQQNFEERENYNQRRERLFAECCKLAVEHGFTSKYQIQELFRHFSDNRYTYTDKLDFIN